MPTTVLSDFTMNPLKESTVTSCYPLNQQNRSWSVVSIWNHSIGVELTFVLVAVLFLGFLIWARPPVCVVALSPMEWAPSSVSAAVYTVLRTESGGVNRRWEQRRASHIRPLSLAYSFSFFEGFPEAELSSNVQRYGAKLCVQKNCEIWEWEKIPH